MVHVRVYRAVHFHANADSSLLVGRESGRHRAVMDLRTGFHVARRSDQLRAHRPFAADTADPDPRRLLTLRTSMPPRARLRHIPGHALPIDPPSPPARPRRRRASRPHRQRTQGTGAAAGTDGGRRGAAEAGGPGSGRNTRSQAPPRHITLGQSCAVQLCSGTLSRGSPKPSAGTSGGGRRAPPRGRTPAG